MSSAPLRFAAAIREHYGRTGHGEPIGAAPNDENNQYKDFINMFEELGFKIRYSDLTREVPS